MRHRDSLVSVRLALTLTWLVQVHLAGLAMINCAPRATVTFARPATIVELSSWSSLGGSKDNDVQAALPLSAPANNSSPIDSSSGSSNYNNDNDNSNMRDLSKLLLTDHQQESKHQLEDHQQASHRKPVLSSSGKQSQLQNQELVIQRKLLELQQKYMVKRAISDQAYYILLLIYSIFILVGTVSNSLICLVVSFGLPPMNGSTAARID